MQKELSRYVRNDEAIKKEIIDRVIEATGKDALKDGALFADLNNQAPVTLLAKYGAGDNKNVLQKTKAHAFRKDVYLLGADEEGVYYWLESPTWDCGWYWGFGYVETYRANRAPNVASDIDSHTHISSMTGAQEKYDHEKGAFVKAEYIHNLYDARDLKYTTFSEDEGWKLSELFKSFYLLKDAAALFGSGSAHVSNNAAEAALKDEALAKRINEVMIPAITAEVIKILTPEK